MLNRKCLALTTEQLERYDRHLKLPGWGIAGQLKLLNSKVLVIGVGGLGSPAIQYLAGAGVGTIGFVDGDIVNLSNLPRQLIHNISDLGKLKVMSAQEKINLLNPDVTVEAYPDFVSETNIFDLIGGYDFVVDCVDSFPTKLLINDSCVSAGKPFSHAGLLGTTGQLMTWTPGHACLRCVFPAIPSSFEDPAKHGVLNTVVARIGSLQAEEALKYLLGLGNLLTDQVQIYDAWGSAQAYYTAIHPNKDCPNCGNNTGLIEASETPEAAAGTITINGVKVAFSASTAAELKSRFPAGSILINGRFLSREDWKKYEIKEADVIVIITPKAGG
jgi:molybdopterin-synthase adenylyltransferase